MIKLLLNSIEYLCLKIINKNNKIKLLKLLLIIYSFIYYYIFSAIIKNISPIINTNQSNSTVVTNPKSDMAESGPQSNNNAGRYLFYNTYVIVSVFVRYLIDIQAHNHIIIEDL